MDNGFNRDLQIRVRYEIEYKNDFLNLVLLLLIVTFHSNLVPIASLSTGQQQGGVRFWERITRLKFESYSDLKVSIKAIQTS